MTELDARKVFGRNLSDILYEKRISQKELMQHMKVSSATVSDWCSGKKMPRIDKLTSIANFLRVTMSDLVEEKAKESAGYYLDEETTKVAQEVFDNPDLRILFDAARASKPEDIRMAADILKRLKETNSNG
jgi:transcriptional regulator with XRE-family HTH domain